MSVLSARWFRVYVIPGAILQSVIIGGGYGTGRELVEYFTRYGPLGGLMGMAVTFVCWALVLAVTYEFARVFRVYDYRSFFKELLGPAWIAFEVLYLLMFLLVLAVVASAAGEILRESFQIPYGVGLLVMLAAVGGLVFFGRETVTRSLAIWTLVLYALFVIYFVLALEKSGSTIAARLREGEALAGWAVSGFQYALYNLAVVPAILFSVRELATRREAIGAAVLASLITIIPALLFAAVLGVVAAVVTVIGFFAVLFTGRWPEALRGFLVGSGRYVVRLAAYANLLTDDYPPFSLASDRSAR